MNKRLFIVFVLGFSSGLPLALVSSTLQAWYAEVGMTVMTTGMLSLIGLPYAYRILWGPLLDRYALTRLGKRRSWILATQIALVLGFNALAWLSPNTAPVGMALIALLLACFSATQDMAIEAHRTEYLPESLHALGASFAVFGYRIGLLLSGGLALIIAQYWGWAITYRLMGFLLVFGMFAVFESPEPSIPVQHEASLLRAFVAPVRELAARQGFVALILFVLFFKLGEAFTTTTSGIVMPFLIQGMGFSLESIGYVNKIAGAVAIMIGGFSAGVLLLRWSLFRALLVFGLLQAFTNILFVVLAFFGKNYALFAIAVVSDNFAAGLGTTALVAFFMRIVDKRFTATQFSLLAAISTLPRIFSGPIAALLQSALGWVGLYQVSVILALGYLPFLLMMRNSGIVSEDERFRLTIKT